MKAVRIKSWNKTKLRLSLLTAVYAAFLIWASVEPFSTFRLFTKFATDWEFHMFAYSVLAYLVCLTFHSVLRIRFTCKRQAGATLFAALLSFGFGGFTEALQSLTVYRTPDWTDFQCDLTGAVFGIMAFIFTLHFQRWIKLRGRTLAFAR